MKKARKNIIKIKEKELHEGLDYYYNLILGKINKFKYRPSNLKKDALFVHKTSLEFQKLGQEELDKKIELIQTLFRLNKQKEKDVLEAFALCVEACFRITAKRAYVVQIMGAIALYKKFIIEMSTGEGKTLTAAIAAGVLGWLGKPIHIFTSNDYLAARDAELFEQFYNSIGLTCCSITSSNSPEERKKLYESNIVYTTGKEVLADFLKDRMKEDSSFDFNKYLIDKVSGKLNENDYALRGLEIAIIDEADSVLADDAVTPLIISATAENKVLQKSVVDAYKIASLLKKDEDYKISEKFNDITLTKSGIKIVEENSFELNEIWKVKHRREYLVKQALTARELYLLNKHYIIKEGKVVIVDEKTGRIMEHRSWGNGLHQAIEVKEGLEITDPTTTFAKMSFQRFFRLYTHLCGMSGTLKNLDNEFWQIYEISILKIPTRVPSKMIIKKDEFFLDENKKNTKIIEYINSLNKKGIPVLIGVTSIKDSENLAKELKKIGLQSKTLNALHDEDEANIISQAGQKGSITIATNMAGRGTDIDLSEEINSLGGLHVITTQRDKSRRIDLQFFGRCARQGENGVAVAFLSLDDLIIKHYLPAWLREFFLKNFNSKLIKKIAWLFYVFYQKKIEKDISNIRNKTLLQEFNLKNSMSYTLD